MASTNPTQHLQQQVLHKYGWSGVYGHKSVGNDDGDDQQEWWIDVTVGYRDTRRFVAAEATEGEKDGKRAASRAALEGLESTIQSMEELPAREISDVFSSVRIEIMDSADIAKSWKPFWDNKPSQVGIDVEGNSISPPVLVQVAYLGSDGACRCILETPHKRRGGLSSNLKKLLADRSILKVFCDNRHHKDKKALGIHIDPNHDWFQEYKTQSGDILDVEAWAYQVFGPTQVPRGLGRILNLSISRDELPYRLGKPNKATGEQKGRFSNVSRFCLIEQGKMKPLYGGVRDLTHKEQRYAALDAYCTLLAYENMQALLNTHTD